MLDPVADGLSGESELGGKIVWQAARSRQLDDFLPEILGMTLYLEWSAIGLIATVNRLEAFGIDPLYYKLHVGIDNAASGHGARARQAVEMYLDQIRASQGDGPMREAWERIWAGYVTFGTLGSLADAINQHFQFNSYDRQVQNLIAAKAPFASQTHGTKWLGGAAINDWFQDPAGMMKELQVAGLIVPGEMVHREPRESIARACHSP